MHRAAFILSSLLLSSTAAFAELPDSVRNEVSRLQADSPVFDAILEDLSQDQKLEALVIIGKDCGKAECEWRLIADRDGKAVTMADFTNRKVGIEPTEGGGSVILADDVIWAFNGEQIFPFADALGNVIGKPALPREIDLIATTTRFTRTQDMRVTLYRADIGGDEREEKIFTIGGIYYADGAWGTPYVIYGANDELLAEGSSTDFPRIFPAEDRKSATIIDVVPAGYAVGRLEFPDRKEK